MFQTEAAGTAELVGSWLAETKPFKSIATHEIFQHITLYLDKIDIDGRTQKLRIEQTLKLGERLEGKTGKLGVDGFDQRGPGRAV